ncbi:NAD-dependent epimerase/dehydratase family protein [Nocardioides houyundeii]|uniref:NAD-dependent epimerase/dehydratase family protein n=1 Tax=Nocardioides houyundeii TaxID=2045452 RepID=UPI000C7752BB|nr:NAD-dependent epimerase/dehydratase family protein [Nocardioides houyundeii]
MRLLVLGGTQFLSRAVARDAVGRGHQVACACRGVSGAVAAGTTHLPWDRTNPGPASVTEERWDAVVDVARLPSQVRTAVAGMPDAHWVFVSTINVYPDTDVAGTPATLRLHEPRHTDGDPYESPEIYGQMKVACEQAVLRGAASATIVRPGLVSGPDDNTGRFTYWPWRLAQAHGAHVEVLAPGRPDDLVQIIDVRDLASWIVDLAERRTAGVFDAVGEIVPLGDLLDRVAAGVGATPELTWVDQDFLQSRGVQPWAGPRSIPLWLPRPEHDGLVAHDPAPSMAAGLRLRPHAETARDTLAWLSSTPGGARTGLALEEEASLLQDWRVASSRPG